MNQITVMLAAAAAAATLLPTSATAQTAVATRVIGGSGPDGAAFAARLATALEEGPVEWDALWAVGSRDREQRILDARSRALFDWFDVEATAERVLVDDKVFRDGGTIKYRRNMVTPQSNPLVPVTFNGAVTAENMGLLSEDESTNFNGGGQAYVFGLNLILDLATNFTTQRSYVSDVNGDGLIDEDPLDGADNDGDGRVDEDFAGISQQMFRTVYYDTATVFNQFFPDEADQHVPMGLEIVQESYVWTDPQFDDFVGIEFSVKNISPTLDAAGLGWEINNAYVGFMIDGDVGIDDDEAQWNHAWQTQWQVNVQAPARLMRGAVRHFRARGGGVAESYRLFEAMPGRERRREIPHEGVAGGGGVHRLHGKPGHAAAGLGRCPHDAAPAKGDRHVRTVGLKLHRYTDKIKVSKV